MKKNFSIIFICLAAILLLAHSFSHNHHKTEHCSTMQCDAHSHHDGGDCTLTNVYTRFENSENPLKIIDVVIDVNIDNINQSIILDSSPFYYKPYLLGKYKIPDAHLYGMRAPPFC